MEYKECSVFTEREQNKNPDWIIIIIKDEHKSGGEKRNTKTKSDESLTKALGPDTLTQQRLQTKPDAFCSIVLVRHHLFDIQYMYYTGSEKRMSPQQYQIATLILMLLFLLFRKWQHFTTHPVPVSNTETVTYVESEKFPLHGIRCAFYDPLWSSRCC